MTKKKKQKLHTEYEVLQDFGLHKLVQKDKKKKKKNNPNKETWGDVNWRTDVAFAEWLIAHSHVDSQHALWVQLLQDYDGIPQEEHPPNAHRPENLFRHVKMLTIPKKKGMLKEIAVSGRAKLIADGLQIKPNQTILQLIREHHQKVHAEEAAKEARAVQMAAENRLLMENRGAELAEPPCDVVTFLPSTAPPKTERRQHTPAHSNRLQQLKQQEQLDLVTSENSFALLEEDFGELPTKPLLNRRDRNRKKRKLPLEEPSLGLAEANLLTGPNLLKVAAKANCRPSQPSGTAPVKVTAASQRAKERDEAAEKRKKSKKLRNKLRAQRRKGGTHK